MGWDLTPINKWPKKHEQLWWNGCYEWSYSPLLITVFVGPTLEPVIGHWDIEIHGGTIRRYKYDRILCKFQQILVILDIQKKSPAEFFKSVQLRILLKSTKSLVVGQLLLIFYVDLEPCQTRFSSIPLEILGNSKASKLHAIILETLQRVVFKV